jgi:hypothetical protein
VSVEPVQGAQPTRRKSRERSSTIEPPVFIHPEIGAHLIDVLAKSGGAEMLSKQSRDLHEVTA